MYPFVRKGLVAGIVLLFIGTVVIPSSGQKIEKPSLPMSGSNTLYVGGSGPGNYTKIQDAIDNASDGDTVFVYDDSSPYSEYNISINKSIELIGENKNTTIIDEGNGVYGTKILKISADDVKVTGFSIVDSQGVYSDTGIYIEGDVGKQNVIRTVSNVNISGNIFVNTSTAIYETKTHNSMISDNLITSKCFTEGPNTPIIVGIDLEHALNSTIRGNTILYAYNSGIHTDFSHCFIEDNFISYVVQPMNQYGISQGSSCNRIIGNKITNETIGIVSGTSSNVISQNNISCCDWFGIVLAKPSRFNIISNNNISECKHYGIALCRTFCTIVKENNFIRNNISAFFMSSFMTRWVHNYWDNWSGKGPKRINGIFVTHRADWWFDILGIPCYNFDWFPASKPYNILG